MQQSKYKANSVNMIDILKRLNDPIERKGKHPKWLKHTSLSFKDIKWYQHSVKRGGLIIFFVTTFFNENVLSTALSDSSKLNLVKNNDRNKVVSGAIRLFHHISKIFEKQLLTNAHTYHCDKEILKRIRQQTIAYGQTQDD